MSNPSQGPSPLRAKRAIQQQKRSDSPLTKVLHCETCGAEVATDPNQRSYVCPFCDSTYVVEIPPDQSGRQRPEFVIGFAITPDQAQEKFRKWLSANSWYRPGDLAAASIADKMKGVYLPFWSFTMLAESHWQAQIGEYWYRTEHYTTHRFQRQRAAPYPAGAGDRVVAALRPPPPLLQRLPRHRQPGLAPGPVAPHPAVQSAGPEAIRAVFPRGLAGRGIFGEPRRGLQRLPAGVLPRRSRAGSPRSCPATLTAAWPSKRTSATKAPTSACCRSISSATATRTRSIAFWLMARPASSQATNRYPARALASRWAWAWRSSQSSCSWC